MNLQEKIWKNYLIISKINYAISSEKLNENNTSYKHVEWNIDFWAFKCYNLNIKKREINKLDYIKFFLCIHLFNVNKTNKIDCKYIMRGMIKWIY